MIDIVFERDLLLRDRSACEPAETPSFCLNFDGVLTPYARPAIAKCATCGEPCGLSVDARLQVVMEEEAFACNDCCGHGCEDGSCRLLCVTCGADVPGLREGESCETCVDRWKP